MENKRGNIVAKKIASLFDLLDKIPDGIRAAIIPTALTVLGVVMLNIKDDGNVFWLWLCIAFFSVFALIKVLVDYINLKNVRAVERENKELQSCLSWLNYIVEEKIQQLSSVASSQDDIAKKARRTRGKLKYENTARTLCLGLKHSVITFLRNHKSLGHAEVSVTLLRPNEQGTLEAIISRSLHRPDIAQPVYDTQMSIHELDTVAGSLWNSPLQTSLSYSNVKDALSEGCFRYLYEAQEDSIKSIFCYKIIDGVTGQPHTIISIDSDLVGIMPNSNTPRAMDLERIVGHFASRLTLELVYNGMLDELGPFIDARISDAVDNRP